MKEARFHPQYKTLLISTASDSFNVFRPNFDPEDDEPANQMQPEEESKQESTNSSLNTKVIKQTPDVWVDSDEDEEMEERRTKNMNR